MAAKFEIYHKQERDQLYTILIDLTRERLVSTVCHVTRVVGCAFALQGITTWPFKPSREQNKLASYWDDVNEENLERKNPHTTQID